MALADLPPPRRVIRLGAQESPGALHTVKQSARERCRRVSPHRVKPFSLPCRPMRPRDRARADESLGKGMCACSLARGGIWTVGARDAGGLGFFLHIEA